MIREKHSVLKIENITKEFGGNRVLTDINLLFDSPGVYGFLGPNGAGKTTTFKIICALLKPTSGRVLIRGKDVRRETKSAMRHIGVQFDSPTFYPYLSGEENLNVIVKWLRTEKTQDIKKLLSFAGLKASGSKKVKDYSWGMKQRLGLAAALLPDPELLLLDEPTNGLDPAGIAYIRGLLPRLAAEQGRTVILSSHRMEEVEQVCDNVIIINRGTIIASGSPAELASGRIFEFICDNPNSAVDILKKHDKVTAVSLLPNNKIQISTKGLQISKLETILTEYSVCAKSISERRDTLESIFLRLIKEDNNED